MLEIFHAWKDERRINKVVEEQYAFSANVSLRRNLQENTEDGIDLHEEILRLLNLQGDETIIDEGFGDGRDLVRLAQAYEQLKLYGLEIPGNGFEQKVERLKILMEQAGITNSPQFIQGYARKIPLPESSVDVAFKNSVLYHEKRIMQALYENQRVVKPGGKIVVVTNGANNRQLIKGYIRDMAAELGAAPPAPFSARFDLGKAQSALGRYFGVVNSIEQDTLRKITHDDVPTVLGALDSYRSQFPRRTHEHWLEARRKVVEEPLRELIEAGGGYTHETVHWGGLILVNDRPAGHFRKLANLALAGR